MDTELPPDPVIEALKKDVDRTLLRANLRLTPEERLLKMQGALIAVTEMRTAFEKARRERR